MTIHKQKACRPVNILYEADLDNGVKIDVYGDYAIGSDGKKYYHVGYEKNGDYLETLGWSCDIKQATIIDAYAQEASEFRSISLER
ncbi:MAG: hypothetical protein NC122_10460 [Faecalibacterium sp.]|nr:hypothetical protein [Ruminococcus sp.]MCM1392946.1 hypothetical protein [Ruminococcus sp.]MCM1486612.1 hypothetical protein [Faecalibacterium sp.]